MLILGRKMRILSIAIVLLGVLAGPPAQAEFVSAGSDSAVFRDSQFIEGSGLVTSSFVIAAPGVYSVSLIDFSFPEQFLELALAITDASANVFATFETGTFLLEFQEADTYFASVYGISGTSDLSVGLFGIEIEMVSMAMVPVPGALVLMLGAIGGLLVRRQVTGVSTVNCPGTVTVR